MFTPDYTRSKQRGRASGSTNNPTQSLNQACVLCAGSMRKEGTAVLRVVFEIRVRRRTTTITWTDSNRILCWRLVHWDPVYREMTSVDSRGERTGGGDSNQPAHSV